MPMSYPPLDNGAYRYGDPPAPRPSPVPGPDPYAPPPGPYAGAPGRPPSHPWRPHPSEAFTPYPAAPGPPGDVGAPGPHPAFGAPAPRRQLPFALAAGGVALVVAVFIGAFLLGGSDDPDPTALPDRSTSGSGAPPSARSGPGGPSGPFDVHGTFRIESAPGLSVSGDRRSCTLPPSLSDIHEGTPVLLTAGGATSRGTLAYDGGTGSDCTFSFDLSDVPDGRSTYGLRIIGHGSLTFTEAELRDGPKITLKGR